MTTKDENILPCVEINPEGTATHSVIWLHGLGADGNDFVPLIPELKLPHAIKVRFIFPHAPIIPVTLNNGFEMRAWYDIYGFSLTAKIDKPGISQSVLSIEQLIEREVNRGIPYQAIFLAGFSQGAAIALTTGLTHKQPLCGIIALSGYLPSTDTLKSVSSNHQHTPIFQAHGTNDPIVPCPLGELTRDTLIQAGYTVDWHSYPMQHSVCAQEVNDLSQWLQKILRQ